MPVRKKRPQAQRINVSSREIEQLRKAIQDGYPWMLHHTDRMFRQTGLDIRANILLSYVTRISAGVAPFLPGENHPSKKTVLAVREQLKDDIAAAEKKYKSMCEYKNVPIVFSAM